MGSESAVPVLPLIDLLILAGWTSLMTGCLLKAIHLTTHLRPKLLGMSPGDLVIAAGVMLLFALTLAARTWVKLHEPRLVAARRRRADAIAELGDPRVSSLPEPRRAGVER
jgi:hypothetical protein